MTCDKIIDKFCFVVDDSTHKFVVKFVLSCQQLRADFARYQLKAPVMLAAANAAHSSNSSSFSTLASSGSSLHVMSGDQVSERVCLVDYEEVGCASIKQTCRNGNACLYDCRILLIVAFCSKRGGEGFARAGGGI